MKVLHDRCCGMDVHKRTVSACLIVPGQRQKPQKDQRTFGTTTPELLSLVDWLTAAGCTHVAMESTGPYWKPLYNLLEGSFEVLVANAQHIKAVPGRKTDVRDAEWIASLLQHGLIRGSFIPPRPRRELRELTRYRKSLVQERADEVNRLQKVLEGANIKLASVATDVTGVSGRAILEALVAGHVSPQSMSELARGRMRTKIPELERALTGRIGEHQRFLITQQLAHIDYLDEAIERCGDEIEARLAPDAPVVERLCTIPGVGRRTAESLLAEIGTDMTRFPTHKHLASWAGMCPGNHESAGKRTSGKTRKGNRALRETLVEAARAAARTRNTYLAALFHRLAARRGGKKAVIAVGHTILVISYHLISGGGVYQDLGANHFDQLDRDRVSKRLIKRLEGLGYSVNLTDQQVPHPA